MRTSKVFTNLVVIGTLILTLGAVVALVDRNISMLISTVGAIIIGVKAAMYLRRFRVGQYKKELERRRDTYGDLWHYREDEDKRRYDM